MTFCTASLSCPCTLARSSCSACAALSISSALMPSPRSSGAFLSADTSPSTRRRSPAIRSRVSSSRPRSWSYADSERFQARRQPPLVVRRLLPAVRARLQILLQHAELALGVPPLLRVSLVDLLRAVPEGAFEIRAAHELGGFPARVHLSLETPSSACLADRGTIRSLRAASLYALTRVSSSLRPFSASRSAAPKRSSTFERSFARSSSASRCFSRSLAMASASVAPAGCDAIFFSSAARSLASVSSFVSCSTRRVFASRRFASASFAAERVIPSPSRAPRALLQRRLLALQLRLLRRLRDQTRELRFQARVLRLERLHRVGGLRVRLALLRAEVSLQRLARRVVAGEEVRVRAGGVLEKRARGFARGVAADARAVRVRLLLVHEYLHEPGEGGEQRGPRVRGADAVQRGLADLERVPELLEDDGDVILRLGAEFVEIRVGAAKEKQRQVREVLARGLRQRLRAQRARVVPALAQERDELADARVDVRLIAERARVHAGAEEPEKYTLPRRRCARDGLPFAATRPARAPASAGEGACAGFFPGAGAEGAASRAFGSTPESVLRGNGSSRPHRTSRGKRPTTRWTTEATSASARGGAKTPERARDERGA